MKKEIKYIIKQALRYLTGFTKKFILIKNNRILFYSYGGRDYSDSPAAICNYILENDKKRFEIIWAFNDIEKIENFDKTIKIIKFRSLTFIYYYLSSKFIVSNIGPMYAIKKSDKQIFINTWHGGGAYKADGIKRTFKDEISFKEKSSVMVDVDLFLSSSKIFSKKFILESYLYDGKILNTGLPRNDILFKTERFNEIKQKVRRCFEIDDNTKIILYAPTWRDYDDEKEEIDFEEFINVLEDKYNCKWCVLYRGHQMSVAPKYYFLTKDATKYPDVQELLIATDMLISDYSSIIWDYSILERPYILFVPDYDKYKKEFGFYTDIACWGGVICKNNAELINQIKDIDMKKIKSDVKKSKSFFGTYETGNACKKVYDFLIKNMINRE